MDQYQKLESYKLLINMAKKTTSTMESDSILQFILEGIISVLPYVDGGILYLYEEDKELLKKVATVNIDYNDSYLYIKPGDNVSGKCFIRRDCTTLNSKEIYCNYIDKKTFPDSFIQYPYSAMTCCLLVEGKALGAVTICNYKYQGHVFSEDDLELLNAAAQHAAITILKSQLIKKKDFYMQKLEDSNNALAESNKMLEATVEMQNNFTNIVLNSSGFSKILEYLKEAINCHSMLFDAFFHLTYSTDQDKDEITFSQLIDNETIKKIIDREHYDNIYYEKDQNQYIISPVVGQKKLLGFLLVILHNKIFSKKDEAVINHVSLVLALEWLRQDDKTKSFSDASNKFLDATLKNPIQKDAIKFANNLGLNSFAYFCLVVVKCDDIETEDLNNYLKRIINIIKNIHLKGIAFIRENNIFIIFNLKEKLAPKITIVNKIEDDILALNDRIKILRGGLYKSIDHIYKSYNDVKLCMKMIVDYDLPLRKIDYNSLGTWQVLLKLDKEDLHEYAINILHGLIKNERNKELLNTLKAYLSHNKNIRNTAKELNIHFNTMYFRINRIEKILGKDLNDENDLFDIQFALKIINKI